jgi:hypothetical protein
MHYHSDPWLGPTRAEAERARERREINELLAKVDREDAAEEQAKRARQIERVAKAAEQTARNTQPQLARSRMSVSEKSAYIAKHGQSAYLGLPWSE